MRASAKRMMRVVACLTAVSVGLSAVPCRAASVDGGAAALTTVPAYERRPVLVFPLGWEPEVTQKVEGVPAAAWTALKAWLAKTGVFEAVAPDPSCPTLQRAVREQRLKQEELTTFPYSDETVFKIAREFGDPIIVAGAVSEYRYDASANRAEISLSLTVVDPANPNARRTVGVSGMSKPQPTVGTQEALIVEAADDAGLKAAAAIAGITPDALKQRVTQALSQADAAAKTAKKPVRRGISRGFLFMLAAIATGIAANVGGGGLVAAA
ncbi:MAG: hypothetical protein ACP5R4_05035, partial [Armatimonadota bacterium]